jgi:hypothetical protein
MAIIGAPDSWARNKVSDRTSLEESPSMSKAVRRYGINGSKGDFPHGSTGGHEVHESAIAPSIGARHIGGPAKPHSEVVGYDPITGKWRDPTHPNAERQLAGNAIFTHEPLKPQGQAHTANSKFGKPSKVPSEKREGYRTRTDSGALAGDSGPRPSYTGAKGPIRP